MDRLVVHVVYQFSRKDAQLRMKLVKEHEVSSKFHFLASPYNLSLPKFSKGMAFQTVTE